jgi:hypothetical protein
MDKYLTYHPKSDPTPFVGWLANGMSGLSLVTKGERQHCPPPIQLMNGLIAQKQETKTRGERENL